MNVNDRIRADLNGLGRLLASENSATDLLALLIDLDAEPVNTLFDLPGDESYVAEREVQTQGKGRLDLVLRGTDSNMIRAALEMKGASSIHGDQLERYAAWASAVSSPPPGLYFCAFDAEEGDVDSRWTRLRLKDVYARWRSSTHQHAAWLAKNIVETFDRWDSEADGRLGASTGYYVNDIVTKRIARALVPRLADELSPANAHPARDNAGSPMVFAWAAHPRDREDCSVSVGVDLRTSPRRQNGKIWKLRPHVEVDLIGSDDQALRTRNEAQTLAFDLASRIHESMSFSSLKEELSAKGLERVANALSGGRYDGFKAPADAFDFDAHRRKIAHLQKYPGAGPFGSDKGLRIATILDLDVTLLTRNDVEDLVVEIVTILFAAASRELERGSGGRLDGVGIS